ncbi:CRP-like cAMP-binding protein [Flavobacterium croceum DSM 17960]|uniref:CRP-like cAMP-binding protein n=1 Tax=Flavobacterium croceum DSM 17960 TaxID=1121886 RepID=A0A2S4N7W3_9FLAO|nr:Crp/Fnr family transcriptional regulator [Flavobacterium croceum]POS01453.1 CRP-like cAMP-binding protein [Flavobacterium croceum DSM 17960]
MELILQNIDTHVHLTTEEQRLFLSKTETLFVKSKTIVQTPNKVATEIYFVNHGLLRSFSVTDGIVEHVLQFACEGWWIADMYSFISEKKGNLFIEVFEDSEVVVLNKENRDLLYEKIPKLERFFRILAENSLVTHQERLIDNLSITAEERFDKFCKKYPTLIQKVPQKHIASYIGVTPEFFSKMKAKMLHKK